MNYTNYLRQFIPQAYLQDAEIHLQNNKSGTNAFVITSSANMYRKAVRNMLAKIKMNGKKPFIAFRSKYYHAFIGLGYPLYEVKSDAGFFRIELSDFFERELNKEQKQRLTEVIGQMFLDTMNFSSFGCCDLYTQCSDKKKCLHEDLLYATSCMYRKNLERGKIFYGDNKNV